MSQDRIADIADFRERQEGAKPVRNEYFDSLARVMSIIKPLGVAVAALQVMEGRGIADAGSGDAAFKALIRVEHLLRKHTGEL